MSCHYFLLRMYQCGVYFVHIIVHLDVINRYLLDSALEVFVVIFH